MKYLQILLWLKSQDILNNYFRFYFCVKRMLHCDATRNMNASEQPALRGFEAILLRKYCY